MPFQRQSPPESIQHPASTPQRPKHTHSRTSRSGGLDETRDAVVNDAGQIPVVLFEDFMKHVLPADKELDHLQITKHCLMDGSVVRHGGSAGTWKHFLENPKDSTASEEATFKPLIDLWNDIIAAAKKVYPELNPVLKMTQHPTKSQASERPISSRPDCVLELMEPVTVTAAVPTARGKQIWENTILPMEFKKAAADGDQQDNAQKILMHGAHILRTDPCRRFTFGITIEDTQLRVWHFSRAGIITTTSINWLERHADVVRLVTSFAFACKSALGLDPTVTRVLVGDEIQYEYSLNGQTYVTEGKPLFDYRADAVEGRATRVWKVHPKDDKDRHFALKDIWMFSDAETEGNILKDILSRVDEKSRCHFLTVEQHGFVEFNGHTDRTSTTIMRRFPPIREWFQPQQQYGDVDVKPSMTGSSRNTSHGHTPERHPLNMAAKRSLSDRSHYRVVFEEVCEALHDLTDLKLVYEVLRSAVSALETLHTIGIVHGDVSTGNILYYDPMRTAKLADLEYSRSLTDTKCHEFRTGTAAFMAVEIATSKYCFRPDKPIETLDIPTISYEEGGADSPLQVAASIPEPPFRYGILHDLESIWWIAVWWLCHTSPASQPLEMDVAFDNGVANLFGKHLDVMSRLLFLQFGAETFNFPGPYQAFAKQFFTLGRIYVAMARATYKTLETGGTASTITMPSVEAPQSSTQAQACRSPHELFRDALPQLKQPLKIKFFDDFNLKKRKDTHPSDRGWLPLSESEVGIVKKLKHADG